MPNRSIWPLVWGVLSAPLLAAGPGVATSYVAYRFTPGENWQARASKLAGNRWSIDFSQGSASISPPDRVLLGNVGKLRLRVRGAAKGHPVHIALRTHFMTFYKVAGEFPGTGELEMVIDGPPGPGWEWMNGENDGRIHGPIRIGEIRLEANGLKDRCELELVSITVDGAIPAEKRCVMTARSAERNFESEIRCLSDAPLAGNLNWVMRDWSGKQLAQGRREVTIPAGAEPLAIPAPRPDVASNVKFIEAEFTLDLAGQEVPAVQACWLRPEERRPDPELRPESPFGMGLYLGRYKAGAEMERAAREASAAGVKWSREGFTWAAIEPQKGRFNWTFQDGLVACAKRNGISIYGQIGSWAPWTKAYSEEGIADYAVFLKELVSHYKNDVHHWEIWNEPNIFFWQGPRDMYAMLLTRAYAAIKEADPSAKVLGLSTAGIDFNFIARMLGKQAPFDIITIHPYRRTLDDQVFIRELKIVSDLVKVPDGPRRPVWITEMGWTTCTPHNTIRQDFVPTTLRSQAELIARSYLDALVSGVDPNTSWYDFRNDGDDPIYFEHQMGIVYRDFTSKPAYNAYATLAEVLKGKKLAGPIDLGPGVFAYRFSGGGKSVIALWNPTGDAQVKAPMKRGEVTFVNTIGETEDFAIMSANLMVLERGTMREIETPASVYVDLKKGAPMYLKEK